ncbi:unnamed protein product, partial [Prorocentrum cordatum]
MQWGMAPEELLMRFSGGCVKTSRCNGIEVGPVYLWDRIQVVSKGFYQGSGHNAARIRTIKEELETQWAHLFETIIDYMKELRSSAECLECIQHWQQVAARKAEAERQSALTDEVIHAVEKPLKPQVSGNEHSMTAGVASHGSIVEQIQQAEQADGQPPTGRRRVGAQSKRTRLQEELR